MIGPLKELEKLRQDRPTKVALAILLKNERWHYKS